MSVFYERLGMEQLIFAYGDVRLNSTSIEMWGKKAQNDYTSDVHNNRSERLQGEQKERHWVTVQRTAKFEDFVCKIQSFTGKNLIGEADLKWIFAHNWKALNNYEIGRLFGGKICVIKK